jgi:hypothetical protein
MVEAFWARMQVALLNRKLWKTRVELASAIHDYIEISHNTQTPQRPQHAHTQRIRTDTNTNRSPPDSSPPTPGKPGQINVSIKPGPLHKIAGFTGEAANGATAIGITTGGIGTLGDAAGAAAASETATNATNGCE